mgnify:CR=1 FL=1|tara:strand:- start:5815 stop:7326 length:1512 start_codon:yes stop_codon:yes gene_type:complete
MAYVVEVKYFNSFVLKKVVAKSTQYQQYSGISPIDWGPTWPSLITATDSTSSGSFNNNTILPVFPVHAYDPTGSTPDVKGEGWAIEESRIRGGFNNTQVGYGVRAYAVEPQPNASLRENALIYSGIYNSRTGVNDTNDFSVAAEITKSADPANGSIQKLYAEDTNLIIFQQSKVSRALIDKDAIYTAEGGGAITNAETTIGTIQPYAGEYGISNNPESFAVYGYNKYFTDADRNAVLRLSNSGIDEISRFGMVDYFRDNLAAISATQGVANGSYDIYTKQYVLNIKSGNPNVGFRTKKSGVNDTLTFDETVQGWVSFMSFRPDFMFSIKGRFYTTINDEVYIHNSLSVDHGSFYGITYDSAIEFISNPQVSLSKVFKTINYEGDSGWEVSSITTSENDIGNNVYSYLEGTYDSSTPPLTGAAATGPGFTPPINYAGFMKQEGKYKAMITNNTPQREGEVLEGLFMTGVKGYFTTIVMKTDEVTNPGGRKELFCASLEYVESSY